MLCFAPRELHSSCEMPGAPVAPPRWTRCVVAANRRVGMARCERNTVTHPQQTTSDEPWIVKGRHLKAAAFRVFGFHFAGGSASQFRFWDTMVSNEIEILGVQLPGRESRYREPP